MPNIEPNKLKANVDKQSLQHAFQQFNEVSSNLSEVYAGLENKISLLSQELADTRAQKLQQFEEKERVANRLANLLEVLPGGIIVLSGEGIIQECNPAAQGLLGDNLVGKSWREIVADQFRPKWDDGHDVTMHDGRSVNISTQSLGEQPGQIVLLTETTETRQLQDQISGLKRVSAMGEMAAAMAHQIRTPLSSALLYVSNLDSPQLDEVRKKRFISKSMNALQHLEKLVEEMLLFSRGGRLNTRPVAIHSLVQDIIQRNHDTEQTQLAIQLHSSVSDDVLVELSKDAFISAIQNLINNSCQASRELVSITFDLGLSESATHIFIKVSDDGPGIPDGIKDSIFEPFVTGRQQGNGLGLAVVDSVIRAMNGTIQLQADNSNGACFVIRLPVYQDATRSQE